MRPTGVVLIAIYHFIGAAFLLLLAVSLVVGGSVLGAMFGGSREARSAEWDWGSSSAFSGPHSPSSAL